MPAGSKNADRIHVIAHAGSARKDVTRFGFGSSGAMLDFARRHLPEPFRLTGSERFFDVDDDEAHGGRHDDEARAADLQDALDDPRTAAIVAANGGAYFTRILPGIDFARLARRRNPLCLFGFSEMTTLLNIVASYACGRCVYWLCPNYLAWKIEPAAQARIAFAEFWKRLPQFAASADGAATRRAKPAAGPPSAGTTLAYEPVRGRLAAGKVTARVIRLVGGCLSVLVPLLAGPHARRLAPRGHWLVIEDVNEASYRIDRHLSALKLAGWFDRIGGVLVGDFHTDDADQIDAVLAYLRYHLPPARRIPVVVTRDVGHVWPMRPLPLNRPLPVSVRSGTVLIG